MTDKPAEQLKTEARCPDMEQRIEQWQKWARDVDDDSLTPLDLECVADYIDKLQRTLLGHVLFTIDIAMRGDVMADDDVRQTLENAKTFVNRFIVHDGEAKPYSVRDGQVMLEQAEDLNRRAADLMRDACLRYNGPQDDGLHGAVDKWLDDFKGRRLP